MQTVACLSCGAPVNFRSHASVMAVCEYCNATMLKDADTVRYIGKMSAVLEDYSPIQVGSSGAFGSRNFNVVGRIQLRYAHGMWNEWYLVFDDASTGWLGDSSGLYVITTVREATKTLPSFDDILPGRQYDMGGQRFTSSEKQVAQCIGGQGELPFKVEEGWEAKVADFRSGASFVTLDYSDGEQPAVYNGTSVTLADLKMQLLREDDQIKASAGKFRGKLDALDCPSCGSSIKYIPGVTSNLVCPACAAALDAAGPEATVLAAGESVAQRLTTLQLGATAKIQNADYTVIGAMIRADEEGTEWNEYLLYSTRNSFFWLVETDEGWFRATVQHKWPEWASLEAESATLDNVKYTKLYDYTATVNYAAGAFNWRVAAGDTVQVYEFENGDASLAAEVTAQEMTWSRSTPVEWSQVKAWFGDGILGSAPAAKAGSSKPGSIQSKFLWWILGLNAVPLVFAFSHTFLYTIIALIAIYFPSSYFKDGAEKK